MGYSKETQPDEGAPKVQIGGITLSGNPDRFNEGGAVSPPAEGSPNNGGNPNIPSGVSFASGHDCRYYGGGSGADPNAGKGGM